jgi:4-amino-4-deoxy-L-arabinose transferase-like glycosyltransferase
MKLSAEGNKRQQTMLWAALALAAGVLLRAAFVWNHARFAGDTLTYGDLAHNLLAHHIFGFTENRIRPTLIRLPGYPLFLAACFVVFGTANYLAVLWVQVIIDLLNCALLGLTAARLMGRRAGFATLWLAALCPFTANYAAAPLTETLSIFCVALAFFALERWLSGWRIGKSGSGWSALIGVALAYAVLLRPDQGLLAAAVVPAMAWVSLRTGNRLWSARLRPAAIVCVVVALPLLGWAARNWRTFHVIQPLAPRYANDPGEPISYGFQRWYRTWAIDFKATLDVYWKYDGDTIHMNDLPRRAFDSAKEWQDTNNLIAAYNQQTSASTAFDREFDRIAAERIKTSPLRYYILLPLARDLNMWLRPRTEFFRLPVDWWRFRLHPKRSALVAAYGLWNAAYLALAFAGLWLWSRRGWSGQPALAAAMLGFVALRFALLLTLDNSEPRYTLECYPAVFLLAGIALAAWRTSTRAGSAAPR